MARHPYAILADELWPIYREHFRRVTFDGPDNVISDGYVRSVYLSDPRSREDAQFIVIPSTGGPDVFGRDFVAESNFRSLIRDFGEDTFVTLGYMNRNDLMLPILPGDMWDDESDEYATATHIADVVRSLFDYPLYDESDYSEMECAAAAESWDDWLSWDVRRNVENIICDSHGETVAEIAEEWMSDHDEDLRQRFDAVRAADNLYWECDSSDIIFPDWETHTAPMLAAYVLTAIGHNLVTLTD